MAVADNIPYMAPDNERRARGRNGEVRKRFSLFRRIQRLSPTRAAEPETDPEEHKGGTWRLTRRIQVREHWRDQPFGKWEEGRTRAILIRTHQRGTHDGLPLHPLVKVGQ